MKATLAKTPQDNAFNYGRDKETIQTYTVVGIHNGKFVEPVTLRLFMGRSNTATVVYASLWIHAGRTGRHPQGYYAGGHGSAKGYGYHKASAAAQAAFDSAGVSLQEDIGGRGDSAIGAALEALARALGYKKFHIVRA